MIRHIAANTSPAGPPPTIKLRAPPAVSTPSPTRAGFDMRYGSDDWVISCIKTRASPAPSQLGRALASTGLGCVRGTIVLLCADFYRAFPVYETIGCEIAGDAVGAMQNAGSF